MSQVLLEQVSKTYPNGVAAVRGLNLTVAAGELVTLVGPSGCGKTTTLRLIAGLEDPTEGNVFIGGRKANNLPPRQRDIAMVFQKHSLYPHLTVLGNLEFGWRLRHPADWLARLFAFLTGSGRKRSDKADIAERVADAARMLDLEAVLDRMPNQLSGGQQQRAALGKALVRQPAIFLLDEPLSHLDARLRAEIRQQLHLLHRRLAATMIYVTHDQAEAMTLGERLVVMDEGVIQQADTPAMVYQHPRNRFVAGFLGWPPMNLAEGRFIEEDGRRYFAAGQQRLPLPIEPARYREPSSGRRVTLGIRPEAVMIARSARAGPKLVMKVILVEPVGSDSLVTVTRDDWRMTAKVSGWSPATPGETVTVEFDMNQAHWFDTISGLALERQGPGG
jgi:multiple sugar transport system ATP-binding protein